MKSWIDGIKKKKIVVIIAECNRDIIGIAVIEKRSGVLDHVSNSGISVRKGCRGLGIGYIMMNEVLKAAKKLKTKIVRLEVFPTNKNAISLYKNLDSKRLHQSQIRFREKENLLMKL